MKDVCMSVTDTQDPTEHYEVRRNGVYDVQVENWIKNFLYFSPEQTTATVTAPAVEKQEVSPNPECFGRAYQPTETSTTTSYIPTNDEANNLYKIILLIRNGYYNSRTSTHGKAISRLLTIKAIRILTGTDFKTARSLVDAAIEESDAAIKELDYDGRKI